MRKFLLVAAALVAAAPAQAFAPHEAKLLPNHATVFRCADISGGDFRTVRVERKGKRVPTRRLYIEKSGEDSEDNMREMLVVNKRRKALTIQVGCERG